jgi:CHASE2 domain-containing sensor protein
MLSRITSMKIVAASWLFILIACTAHRVEQPIQITARAYTPPDIILINVGEAGRCEIASMLRTIEQGKPKAIGIDLLFTERRKLECDTMFISALTSSRAIIIKGYSGTTITEPWPEFSDAAFLVGITGLLMDTADFVDFHYRLMPEPGRWSLTFPMLMAMELDKEKMLMAAYDISREPYPTFLKFRMKDFKVVSREDATSEDNSVYKDKLVIIGYLGPLTVDDYHKIHDVAGNPVEEFGAVIFANIVLDVVNRFSNQKSGENVENNH